MNRKRKKGDRFKIIQSRQYEIAKEKKEPNLNSLPRLKGILESEKMTLLGE